MKCSLFLVAVIALTWAAKAEDLSPSNDLWEGQWWKGNIYQGAWFPTVDTAAHYGIDDYSWGQVHTKVTYPLGTMMQFDVRMSLNSSGVNGNLAYFGFGDQWAYYAGNFYGIKMYEGQVHLYQGNGSSEQDMGLIGSYVAGERVSFIIALTPDGRISVNSGSFAGSFKPSATLSPMRCIASDANNLAGTGFLLYSVVRLPAVLADVWEGQWWSQNVGQGSWFPSLDTAAHYGIDDYSWGQLRTKSVYPLGTMMQFDVRMSLNSSGVNGNLAYFGFGDQWAYYAGNFYGIKMYQGQVHLYQGNGSSEQDMGLIGSYVAGERMSFTLSLTADGRITASGLRFSGSFKPSATLSPMRCIVSDANNLAGTGFLLYSAQRIPGIWADVWEGQWWSQNVGQGSWFPTVDTAAHYGIDDYSWGQLHTKGTFPLRTVLKFDVRMSLNSSGVNGNLAYFGFGDQWAYYGGNFYGVKMYSGQVHLFQGTGSSEQDMGLIGSYVAGERMTFTVALTSDGRIRANSARFNGSFKPSATLSPMRCIVSDANNLAGTGFLLYSVAVNTTTGIEQEEIAALPQQARLLQNYPNPFNPNTTIHFEVPRQGHVSLRVFDNLGREVAILLDDERPAGQHMVQFNAAPLASGVYYYRLQAGSFSETKKMVLAK